MIDVKKAVLPIAKRKINSSYKRKYKPSFSKQTARNSTVLRRWLAIYSPFKDVRLKSIPRPTIVKTPTTPVTIT
jgi:hypothetical protein